ncbi:MAG TPA: hypothetical protein VGR97_14435 [Candidatus Acidoferrales bacterium]|nr:hypothetical protein [Candidatus Acidoferrales bacterium]
MPTVTLVSRSFCPLAQMVARGLGFPVVPILLLPHPIGDQNLEQITKKGTDAAEEAVRLLLSPREALEREFGAKKFSLPEHVVPKR